MFLKPLEKQEIGHLALGDREISFTVIRNRRRKSTIAFTIDDDLSLRVLAPARARLSSIKSVLRRRAGWIEDKIAERQKLLSKSAMRGFEDGKVVLYLGHACRLHVMQDETKPHGCTVSPRRFAVNIPVQGLSKKELRDEVRLEVQMWLKKRAKTKFKKRMDLWAEAMGVQYKKLIISSPERRWGSCTVDNVIRLSWRLMTVPLPLLDYVVVHELCHIVHKNHSRSFWRSLGVVMPDYQERRRRLRQSYTDA